MKLFRRNSKPKKVESYRPSPPKPLSRASSNASMTALYEDVPGVRTRLPDWAVMEQSGQITTSISPANESAHRGGAKSKIPVKHWPPPLPPPSSSSQASSNASMRVLVGGTTVPLPFSLSRASSDASMRVHLGDTTSVSPDYIMDGILALSLTDSGRTSLDNEIGDGDSVPSPNREKLTSRILDPSQPHRLAHRQFPPGRGGLVEEEDGNGGTDGQTDFSSTSQAEWTPSLEILMTNHTPLDLSGQVIIPNRANPAHGGLADVHAGLWNNTMVAVKVLRIRKSRRADAHLEASNERRIAREMHVWAALKHPNISEFLGYSTDLSDYPSMISLWYERGTALEYLDRQDRSINERIRLALDVSEGLEFLHRLKVVHGDLKPSNVLIDDDRVARLCDFGLVRLVDWNGPAGMTTTSPYMGTERYKAPELFISVDNRHPVATFEGDIYSLGCIMLEFIEQVYPFQRFRKTHEMRDAIMEGCCPALRSEATDSLSSWTQNLWDLLEACWDVSLGRPSVSVAREALGYLASRISALS